MILTKYLLTKYLYKASLLLIPLLASLLIQCDCGKPKLEKKEENKKETPPTPITDEMIDRARKAGYTFLAKKLEGLKNGEKVDIDEKDATQYNSTALHYATKLGDVDIVKVLLRDYKANPNIQTSRNWTPSLGCIC